MNKAKWILSTVLSLTIIVVLSIGCSQDWSANATHSKPEIEKVSVLKILPQNSIKKLFVGETIIGSAGGSIWVGDDTCGYSCLSFPQGALSSNEDIELYWRSENLFQADCYPEGMQFNEPVYIRLSYKDADMTGIDENDLALYYYNPTIEEWELVSENVNTVDDYVEGHINHFSRYAIGMD